MVSVIDFIDVQRIFDIDDRSVGSGLRQRTVASRQSIHVAVDAREVVLVIVMRGTLVRGVDFGHVSNQAAIQIDSAIFFRNVDPLQFQVGRGVIDDSDRGIARGNEVAGTAQLIGADIDTAGRSIDRVHRDSENLDRGIDHLSFPGAGRGIEAGDRLRKALVIQFLLDTGNFLSIECLQG